MKILAIDTASRSVSAALCEDDFLLGETFLNIQQMHSETLMPAVTALLVRCGADFDQIGLFGVTAGPGSFTGVRIGAAAVKGMALAVGAPCAGVSTLEALAQNLPFFPGTVCAALDARRGQVYAALFSTENGETTRLCPDSALSLDELASRLHGKRVVFVGDGAQMCYNRLKESCCCALAPESLRYTRAGAVAALVLREHRMGRSVQPDALQPVYLRLPQAERELRAKNAAQAQQQQTK